MLVLKSLSSWAAVLFLAFINGGLREAVLLKHLPRPVALSLSGLLLMACILAVSILMIPWIGVRSLKQCFAVGAAWLALTLVFEFGLGIAQGKSLPVILEAYTFKDGNIWPVVLLTVAAAPAIGAYVRGILPAQRAP